MNASQLYTDEYYAWHPYPRRGKFTNGARKARLVNVETRKSRYDTNAKTYAHIILTDTEEKKMVRAREIVGFWDDYSREVEFIRREREDRDIEIRRGQMREMVMSSTIATRLQEKTGMQVVGTIQYQPHAERVSLPLGELVLWLEITEDDINATINQAMEENGNIL
jgi:hypothetical protein